MSPPANVVGHDGGDPKSREYKSSKIFSEICVVGAGPAGLMLVCLLARYGVNVVILDDRADQTSAGRADGLQPKSIETLRQLRLADDLLQKGARIYDFCFWHSSPDQSLRRAGRECHFPPADADLLDDFILLVHQGMVEEVLIRDMRSRGVEVKRGRHFETLRHCDNDDGDALLEVVCRVETTGERETSLSRYVVGCDGARSKVRHCIPDTYSVGKSHQSVWGVLDGELTTDFPDIWSKTVVQSDEHGSILIIPRERNLTRFYIEIKGGSEGVKIRESGQEFVMQRARDILYPYTVEWRTVEWFGNYTVGQRVANKFTDPQLRTFIAGDASHTHSPKAAQGMNTGMHDTWNLAWKLNLVVRGLAKPSLLESYEQERRKIAYDLIDFDYEHANEFANGDAKTLAENTRTNVRFISGVGVEYDYNVLNRPSSSLDHEGEAKVGCLVPPAKVTRYIDANPVDVQLDIPILGQFRVYFFVPDMRRSLAFLKSLCGELEKPQSLFTRASQAAAASYEEKPRTPAADDAFVLPERYTRVSQLMTLAVVTLTERAHMEIANLPDLLSQSAWTFYLDNVPHLDTRRSTCTKKWVGQLREDEIAIVVVRPDGYVGSISRWKSSHGTGGRDAAEWFDDYFEWFIQTP